MSRDWHGDWHGDQSNRETGRTLTHTRTGAHAYKQTHTHRHAHIGTQKEHTRAKTTKRGRQKHIGEKNEKGTCWRCLPKPEFGVARDNAEIVAEILRCTRPDHVSSCSEQARTSRVTEWRDCVDAP